MTLSALEEEMVLTRSTFFFLADDHFTRLLPRLKVGQHALLQTLQHTHSVSS